jgi:hypothetical protein
LPINVEVLAVIPCEDERQAEKHLHNIFAKQRGNGEWFSLTAEQIQLLKMIKKL